MRERKKIDAFQTSEATGKRKAKAGSCLSPRFLQFQHTFTLTDTHAHTLPAPSSLVGWRAAAVSHRETTLAE